MKTVRYPQILLPMLNRGSEPLGRVTAYAYGAVGNRTGMTDANGHTTTYAYDALDRPTGTTDPLGNVTSYSYDAVGNRIARTKADGAVISYSYDTLDRWVQTSYPGGTVTYAYDAVGNRTGMTDTVGITVYTYDDLDRLSQVNGPNGTLQYAYDPMGNRTSMTSSIHGATTYSYDAADRLLSYTDPAGTVNLTWDANGNMTGKGSAAYTFDALDRLTQVVSGTTTVQFAYDGDGVRLEKMVDGSTTTYLQDIAAPLPTVLMETLGGQSDIYLYGSDLIARFDPANAASFYHVDGLGSTRALSNNAGQRTDRYVYDVFGAPRSHSGGSDQPFTYTGEQVDGELGLVYLRARYYDPLVGRFTARDKWPSPIRDTQEQNRYVYARNGPINFTDPSGFTSTYWKARVGAFLGLGAAIEYARYTDIETGKTEGIWSFGAGGGFGLKGTVESGVSTSENLPSSGIDVRARAKALGLGVSGKADLSSGKASVGGSVPSIIPLLGLKSEISDDFSIKSSAVASLGAEVSGTLNVRYRTGQLGDWLFDTFWQPRYDAERQRVLAEHERRMIEIQLMKSQNYGDSSWGGPPSGGK